MRRREGDFKKHIRRQTDTDTQPVSTTTTSEPSPACKKCVQLPEEEGGGRGGRTRRRGEEEPDSGRSSHHFLGSNEQDKASAGCLVLAETGPCAYVSASTLHAAMSAPRPSATVLNRHPHRPAAVVTTSSVSNGGPKCG
ncbi:hypothetical protein E2C01_101840 [Portunus trituberculatus]|uniref:Uncharacterized protein n=1 Tax=Portunus trituberculatus TaxID=210409 RepID=A0A5B7KLB7_PORTR|nr:hypothetical protein [Portunus trituberculatus]